MALRPCGALFALHAAAFARERCLRGRRCASGDAGTGARSRTFPPPIKRRCGALHALGRGCATTIAECRTGEPPPGADGRGQRCDGLWLLPAAQVCITARYVKGEAPSRGGRGRVRIIRGLCAGGASIKSRAARTETAPPGAGAARGACPIPERAPKTLAQGGPTRRRLGRGLRRDGLSRAGRGRAGDHTERVARSASPPMPSSSRTRSRWPPVPQSA